jgi:hypothetical protein
MGPFVDERNKVISSGDVTIEKSPVDFDLLFKFLVQIIEKAITVFT